MRWAIVFFVGVTVSTLLVGFNFARTKHRSVRYFGWGLGATGIAFGFWTIGRINNPKEGDDLELWVTIGVFFLLLGLLLFLLSWTTPLRQQVRNLVLVGGLLYVVALIALRFMYPSEPFIDEDGVLFFNPHGSVGALEVGAVSAAFLPAIFEIGRRLRALDALVAKVAFTTVLMSGIILIASIDKVMITIASWVMAAALLALVGTFVVRQPGAWLQATH